MLSPDTECACVQRVKDALNTPETLPLQVDALPRCYMRERAAVREDRLDVERWRGLSAWSRCLTFRPPSDSNGCPLYTPAVLSRGAAGCILQQAQRDWRLVCSDPVEKPDGRGPSIKRTSDKKSGHFFSGSFYAWTPSGPRSPVVSLRPDPSIQ
eukprot:1192606-Prorocentrum_minimum.AAC.1